MRIKRVGIDVLWIIAFPLPVLVSFGGVQSYSNGIVVKHHMGETQLGDVPRAAHHIPHECVKKKRSNAMVQEKLADLKKQVSSDVFLSSLLCFPSASLSVPSVTSTNTLHKLGKLLIPVTRQWNLDRCREMDTQSRPVRADQ
jgi:hypothetical protein